VFSIVRRCEEMAMTCELFAIEGRSVLVLVARVVGEEARNLSSSCVAIRERERSVVNGVFVGGSHESAVNSVVVSGTGVKRSSHDDAPAN
jgi:hypothetical protein